MNTFPCRQCGACCRQPGFVYLTHEDVERLAAHLKMDVYGFTEAHCLLQGRRYLALRKHADERCIFLQPGGCEAYEARPSQCREFPSKWKTERSPGYCEGLKELGQRPGGLH